MSLIFRLGYSPVRLEYTRRRREKGKSRWTLAKKIKLVIDSFVAFSYVPIRTLSTAGLMVALSAFGYAVYIVAAWAARGIPVKGYAPIVILIALTAGVQMMMLGVLGEYLWRVLDETRRRPPFVIDEARLAKLEQRAAALGIEAAMVDDAKDSTQLPRIHESLSRAGPRGR
jgi:dolichol-phosphate mannosyltransferase